MRAVLGAGLIFSAWMGVAHADGQPQRGTLRATGSGKCLGGGGKPGVRACDEAPDLTLQPVTGPSGNRFMIANDAGQCLYSNKDGRFDWYTCTPAFDDQHWTWLAAGRGDPLLRAVNSGQCLFSNADGRFGMSRCEPRFADQRWHLAAPRPKRVPAPPLAPPPAAPRDCGTEPGDRGCQESRAGLHAMERDAFAGLLKTLAATPSELAKRNMIVSATGHAALSAQQLVRLLRLFRSDVTKLQVARGVVARVIDPQRALGFASELRSSRSREELVRILSPPPQPAPTPVPPAPVVVAPVPVRSCPRMPACGIGCPGGMAHDANGCTLCACARPPNPGLH